MANSFNKEEKVLFDVAMEQFQDALVMSGLVSTYTGASARDLERAADVFWRPMPFIAQSFSGEDQTGNFVDNTQLSVPASLGYHRSAPWALTARQLRDALQEGNLLNAAKSKLSSDINVILMNLAANWGTLFVKRTPAATGYDDVALCEAIMNEQGIPFEDRKLVLSTRDYNGMASNLAARAYLNDKTLTAYERSLIGQVASFDAFKLDYANRLVAAAGSGITMSTLDTGPNIYTPRATSMAATGESQNVDNRLQQVTLSSTTNMKAGDRFTVAGINAVHHITKGDTGQLKTFTVISVDSSTLATITPPLITNQVPSDPAAQYQNCVNNSKASNAALVFLNTVTAYVNPFWQKDAFELIPGSFAVPIDAGVSVMKAKTDQGIELVFQKFYDINTMKTKYRLDTLVGGVCKQPEMAGLIMFGQT